jgi:very-short-patch-repair endonuclease
MHKRTTPKIFARAKELHRNMSPAEAKLWKHLRAHRIGDIHFRNHTAPACGAGGMQSVITSWTSPLKGTMCAPRKKLIIELDGGQHLEQQEYDEERTKYLEARGYQVFRFWNNNVMNNTEAILQVIWSALDHEDET